MQKLGQLVLFGLTGLLILAAVVLLGMNLYVQSQGTQARIQRELRHHFDTDIRISRMSVTPWGGLKLSGITIPQADQSSSVNFLEADSFTLQLRFLSLLSHRLVITDVALNDPKVTWPQNDHGKWRLPTRADRESRAETENELVEPPASPIGPTFAPGPSPPPTIEPTITSSHPSQPSRTEFSAEIRRVSLRRGDFRFLDRTGKLVAAFENVELRSLMRDPNSLRGRATIQKISLRDRIFLQELTTPLRYEAGELEFSEIQARAADGKITGHFLMQSESEDSPFSAEAKFRDVQADRLISEAGGPAGVLQGKLEGTFQASGKTADADALAGSGEIVLHEGQIRQYPLLVAIGQIFDIDELTQLHLDQADAKYHLTPGVVTVDQLNLRSSSIHLSATGTITFSGKMNLNSRLSLSEKIYARLYKPIRANFQPTDEAGFYAVDFQVTGSIDHPKNNLAEKALGGGLKDFLNGILRGKSDRPKKRRSAEATPTEEVSPGPNPGITPAPSP